MDAEGRDGVALHIPSRALQTNVRAIQMEVRQLLVEPQSRRFAQDQYDLIECLDWLGVFEGGPADP
jgi:hypothetical protein